MRITAIRCGILVRAKCVNCFHELTSKKLSVIPELPPIGICYTCNQRRLCPEFVNGSKIKMNYKNYISNNYFQVRQYTDSGQSARSVSK